MSNFTIAMTAIVYAIVCLAQEIDREACLRSTSTLVVGGSLQQTEDRRQMTEI